ncbi:MAG: hypothetical protein KDB69_02305 [Acidimicrobiia bacterium]|nr:hypothetical protein [Acidimicrobiia bacterium]
MENEEYEQIPWSQLVAEAEVGVDKRLYVVVGVVAAAVVIILAMRLFGGPTPSSDGLVPPVAAVPTDAGTSAPEGPTGAVVPPSEPVTTIGAISEADLMADMPAASTVVPTEISVVAEWFVTDFYTRDGSPETMVSLEARLDPSLAIDLPHDDGVGPESFVEWAKTFTVTDTAEGYEVSVAFRTVTRVEDGFVRDPVEAVMIEVDRGSRGWIVRSIPRTIPLP